MNAYIHSLKAENRNNVENSRRLEESLNQMKLMHKNEIFDLQVKIQELGQDLMVSRDNLSNARNSLM